MPCQHVITNIYFAKAPLAPAVARRGGGGRHQAREVDRWHARAHRRGQRCVATQDDDNGLSYDDPD